MLMKKEIRKTIKEKRSAMDKAEVAQKSAAAAQMFLLSEFYKSARQFMLYMPLGNETDTSEIMKAAFQDGKSVVLPVTDEKSDRITPCLITEETEFIAGAFSVREPAEWKEADMSKTDVIIVPGIAFDRSGARVGFGKGCYDMLLKSSPSVKVGFCYGFQICDEIPFEEHDIKMDYLVTEKGIVKCE